MAANNGLSLKDIAGTWLQEYYAFYPTLATELGLHEYDGKLPDRSKQTISAFLEKIRQLQSQLQQLEQNNFDKFEMLDYYLLKSSLEQEAFNWGEWRDWEYNPIAYVNPLDISNYIKRNYAPFEERAKMLTQHLEGIPAYLRTARENLQLPLPRPYIEAALEMYEGQIAYFQNDVTATLQEHQNDGSGQAITTLMPRFEQARDNANAAIAAFVAFLKNELPRSTGDWRIGSEKFQRMLATGEMVDMPLDYLLQIGQTDLARNEAALEEVARKIDPNRPLLEVLRSVQGHHPSAERLLPDTRAVLDEQKNFLLEHNIVGIPVPTDLHVEETPPFARWATAMMSTPGPFEKAATEAYYYVTPVEPDWTPEQKEEWLSNFNYGLVKNVSVHEAYPGHYIHFLHVQRAPSTPSKVIASYSMVEGWAHYTEQMMLEAGYDPEDLELQVAQLTDALLRNVRYICAIKMHTQTMTVDEATRMFMEHAKMEELPASKEAMRGTFDPGYLNYTLGKLMMLKLREDYRKEQGAAFTLRDFHDQVLAFGAPPIPLLRRLLLKQPEGALL